MAIDIIARGLAANAIQGTGSTNTITGPLSSGSDNIVIFDGNNGKSLKDSGYRISEFSLDSNRISGDTSLNDLITGETYDRITGDTFLYNLITGETFNRITGDTSLYDLITGETFNIISDVTLVNNLITGETYDRITGDTLLYNLITGETFNRISALNGNGGITGSSAHFGNSTGYTEIMQDGTIKLNGSATVFDDLATEGIQLQKTGSGINFNIPEGTVEFITSSNLLDYLITNSQMPHSWKIGSTIYPHIHYIQTSNSIPNFLLQYRWQVNGSTTTTNWTNYKCNLPVYSYISGSTNQIIHGTGLTPTINAGISDIIQFRVIRDNSNTSGLFSAIDNVNSTVSLKSFDIHYEKYSLGSNTEYN